MELGGANWPEEILALMTPQARERGVGGASDRRRFPEALELWLVFGLVIMVETWTIWKSILGWGSTTPLATNSG